MAKDLSKLLLPGGRSSLSSKFLMFLDGKTVSIKTARR